MRDASHQADWDKQPPVAVEEYERMVRRVNVGYEFSFTLVLALLRALGRADLNLLVVGAGGGMELVTFAGPNPAWRLTGVDPSEKMLALAQAKVEALHLQERVTLVRGTVDDLSPGACFDAATCIFVLHLLPDDASRLAVLRGIARHLPPAAPLLVVTPVATQAGPFGTFEEAWQQYGELMGMPGVEMAATLQGIKERVKNGITEEQYRCLFKEAGFETVETFLTAFTMVGWRAYQRPCEERRNPGTP